MRMRNSIYKCLYGVAILACVLLAAAAAAREYTDHERPYTENREKVSFCYAAPDSKHLRDSTANTIADSIHTLEGFMQKLLALRSGADSVVSILHIGDSHLQAGIWSSRVRDLFHEDFGNAGRGLIVPYKLSGTNEPRNYAIRSPHPVFSYRGTEKGLTEIPGFTGLAVAFEGQESEFNIWSKNSFNAVTVFHHEKAPMLHISEEFDPGTYCTIDNTPTSTRIVLSQTTDTLTLKGKLTEQLNNPTFYGFMLENGQPGVLYHMIGLNGAAFEHISGNTSLLESGAEALRPDLIIVSLGTNNCFGSGYRSEQFRSVARRFVKKIKTSYPYSAILMTTPIESCRRSRRVYTVNPNVADVARVIVDVCREEGVAYWNMFDAAGGDGSNAVWHENKLIRDDRIHLSEQGYVMLGDMLYEAITGYYNDWLDSNRQDTHQTDNQ